MAKNIFFEEEESEHAYGKQYFLDRMKEEGLTEMKVFKAEIEYDTEHFYCSFHQEVGIKGDDYGVTKCGGECKGYKPRNGVSGRCVHSKNCYTPGEEITLKRKP